MFDQDYTKDPEKKEARTDQEQASAAGGADQGQAGQDSGYGTRQ